MANKTRIEVKARLSDVTVEQAPNVSTGMRCTATLTDANNRDYKLTTILREVAKKAKIAEGKMANIVFTYEEVTKGGKSYENLHLQDIKNPKNGTPTVVELPGSSNDDLDWFAEVDQQHEDLFGSDKLVPKGPDPQRHVFAPSAKDLQINRQVAAKLVTEFAGGLPETVDEWDSFVGKCEFLVDYFLNGAQKDVPAASDDELFPIEIELPSTQAVEEEDDDAPFTF